MEFKEGDKVQVIKNQNDHQFFIGEYVEITEVCEKENGYRCSNGCDFWYLGETEVSEIIPKTLTTHEDQPISDFAQQVKEFITKEWGSHNLDAFVEAFKGKG